MPQVYQSCRIIQKTLDLTAEKAAREERSSMDPACYNPYMPGKTEPLVQE